MKPIATHQRIVSALRLQSMTTKQVALCLSISYGSARVSLEFLTSFSRVARRPQRTRHYGAPSFMYEVRS